MKNKIKILFISYAVILLCTCFIVTGTYALFTDSAKVTNHLKAGNLDIKLERVNLEYQVLNEEGYLEKYSNQDRVNFTGLVGKNIFGLDSKDILIVPGSYFEATLEIKNNGNVAFEYRCEMILSQAVNELSKQVVVTITDSNNAVSIMSLSDISNGYTFKLGEMNNNVLTDSFTIRLEFLDDAKNNLEVDNNSAKNQELSFDLVVEAVQKEN